MLCLHRMSSSYCIPLRTGLVLIAVPRRIYYCSAQDSESSDLTSTTSTSSTNLSAANHPQQRFLLQRQSSSEGAGRFSSNSGSLETLPRRGSNPDAASGAEGGEGKDHLNHPLTGGVSTSSSTAHLQAQDPMIRQLCSCSCVGWAEIVVRRPTGSMSWVMRIQNQMYQDLFAVDDVFPTLHDISNLFMPTFGAMALSVRGDSGEESPRSLTANAGGQAGKEVEKLAQAAGFTFGEKSSVDEVQKGTPEDVVVTVGGGGGGGHKATASGPIAIPKQPKAVKESGSISDRDSDDGIVDGDEDENNGRRGDEDEGDGEYDDEEGGSRSRNPVRRVNSSPEMRSNYRNPYLLNKQQQQKDKDGGGSTNGNNPTGTGAGGGLTTPSVEGNDGEGGVEGGAGASGGSGQQQWKKGGGGYSKDMRVSCEAIPEEMTGQTPPSKTGSVASSESVLAGAETTAVLLRETTTSNRQDNENKVKGGSSESSMKSTATLTAKKEDAGAVEAPVAKSSPLRQQRQPQATAAEEGALKLQVNLIPAEKPVSTVVTAKPPQSPAPLSPRLLSKTSSMSHRVGGMMTMMDGGGPMGGHMMPFGGGPPMGDDEIRRGRSNTISVVQERHTKHSTLRGRNAGGGPGGSGPGSGVGSSGLGSTVSSSGSIPSRTSGRSSVGGGGGGGIDGGLPRPSGISPSFVFLQLFHSDQKPLRVDAANEKTLKMLDLIPPMEVYKIGVLYVGPGQVDKEQEILRNRCGSYRYTKFLSGLGSLLSVEQAKVANTYTSLDPTNPMDGKFTYIWQDDIAQLQFHVATLMPTRESDPKCATKKLHIGNDYVMIIFNESGEEYDPSTFVTQFNYVSVVVEPLEMRSNRISVKVRDNLIDNKWEAKIVSDECAPLLARQLALHANVSIPSILYRSTDEGMFILGLCPIDCSSPRWCASH